MLIMITGWPIEWGDGFQKEYHATAEKFLPTFNNINKTSISFTERNVWITRFNEIKKIDSTTKIGIEVQRNN